MRCYTNYVSTSVFGDGVYYQAMFEAEQDADDPHSPYLSIERQFEDQSDDLCYKAVGAEAVCRPDPRHEPCPPPRRERRGRGAFPVRRYSGGARPCVRAGRRSQAALPGKPPRAPWNLTWDERAERKDGTGHRFD